MSGIFPFASDGGVQPPDADNALAPTVPPLGTDALYFGNNCGVRLRPAVINAVLSEILCVIDSAQMAYNPASLCNLRDAIAAAIHQPRLMIWNVPGSYNWTVPARIEQAEVTVIGGGGAGGGVADGTGGSIAGNAGGGGGGGGFAWRLITGLTPGDIIPIIVAAGGAGVVNNTGLPGGLSRFGSFLQANGGAGGAGGGFSTAATGTGGTGTGGMLNISGAAGGWSGPNYTTVTMSDAMRVYTRGGMAAGGLCTVNFTMSGNPGQGYGAGGTGGTGAGAGAGGAGAPGIVIVRW